MKRKFIDRYQKEILIVLFVLTLVVQYFLFDFSVRWFYVIYALLVFFFVLTFLFQRKPVREPKQTFDIAPQRVEHIISKKKTAHSNEHTCYRCSKKFIVQPDSKVYKGNTKKWCPKCISKSFEGIYDHPSLKGVK